MLNITNGKLLNEKRRNSQLFLQLQGPKNALHHERTCVLHMQF